MNKSILLLSMLLMFSCNATPPESKGEAAAAGSGVLVLPDFERDSEALLKEVIDRCPISRLKEMDSEDRLALFRRINMGSAREDFCSVILDMDILRMNSKFLPNMESTLERNIRKLLEYKLWFLRSVCPERDGFSPRVLELLFEDGVKIDESYALSKKGVLVNKALSNINAFIEQYKKALMIVRPWAAEERRNESQRLFNPMVGMGLRVVRRG